MVNTEQTDRFARVRVTVKPASDGQRHKKVFICSPFTPIGETRAEMVEDMNRNIHLAQTACRYAAMSGFIPYAPHLYFTQFLDDGNKDEREYGQALGLSWLATCSEMWIVGRRLSEGMKKEIQKAKKWGIPIRYFVPKRTPDERLIDAILYPDKEFHEMTFENVKGGK